MVFENIVTQVSMISFLPQSCLAHGGLNWLPHTSYGFDLNLTFPSLERRPGITSRKNSCILTGQENKVEKVNMTN